MSTETTTQDETPKPRRWFGLPTFYAASVFYVGLVTYLSPEQGHYLPIPDTWGIAYMVFAGFLLASSFSLSKRFHALCGSLTAAIFFIRAAASVEAAMFSTAAALNGPFRNALLIGFISWSAHGLLALAMWKGRVIPYTALRGTATQ